GLGAILAHAFYDLTAKALATASIQPEERPRVFAELTLNWLRATEGGIGAGRPSVVGELQIVAKAIEDVETQFFTTRNLLISEPVAKLFCQRLTQHFAGLTKSDWFHRGEACSSP
ncbi:hypothetical protein EBZ37_07340, partial [bacterium]|nr:hypothetical protein [bacterium]